MGRNEFLILQRNYLQKIVLQYVTCVHRGESRACLCGQTGVRKKNSVYNHMCTCQKQQIFRDILINTLNRFIQSLDVS